jgi:hypothetical protein
MVTDNSQISAVDSISGLLTGKISDEIDRKTIREERISKYEIDELSSQIPNDKKEGKVCHTLTSLRQPTRIQW